MMELPKKERLQLELKRNRERMRRVCREADKLEIQLGSLNEEKNAIRDNMLKIGKELELETKMRWEADHDRERNIMIRRLERSGWNIDIGNAEKVVEKIASMLTGKDDAMVWWERSGIQNKTIIRIRLKTREDVKKALEANRFLRMTKEMSVEEDLSWEERRKRWVLKEKIMEERRKGKFVKMDGRRAWMDGHLWDWDEEKNKWIKWTDEKDKQMTQDVTEKEKQKTQDTGEEKQNTLEETEKEGHKTQEEAEKQKMQEETREDEDEGNKRKKRKTEDTGKES